MVPKIKKRWMAIAVCMCVAVNSKIQTAGTIQDEINSAGEKINELEDELQRAEGEISAYQKEQQILEQDISQGQEKISGLSSELDQTRDTIKSTQDAILKTQEALEQSRKDSKEQYAQMKQRIRFMYENSTESMITYVLEAGSLPEALRRVNYFQAVMDYGRKKLEEYKETTQKIKKEEQALLTEKEELESLERQQSEKLTQIDDAVAELKQKLNSKLSQIENSEALRQQYEQELQKQKDFEAELERRKAEEDRKREEEIRKQQEEFERQERERKAQEEERRRQEEERKRREAQERQQAQQAAQDAESETSDAGSESGTDESSSVSGSSGSSYAASASELELLSTIIYCEAGNQSYEGQLAVGSVIMNRVASGSFPNSISGVIYQSGQFSPVASGRFAQALAAGLGSYCTSAAQAVLGGTRNVSCLYFRINTGAIDGLIIGDHVFY